MSPKTPLFYAHSLPGKDKQAWQTLDDHLQCVAEMAATRAERFGMMDAGYAAGLLHDLGKYSAPFQRRLEGSPERVDHSTAGAIVAKQQYGKGMAELLAYCITGHHAGLANGRDPGERSPLSERLKADIPAIDHAWKEALTLPKAPNPPSTFTQRPERAFFQLTFLTRMLFSCLVDADYIDTETFYTKHETGLAQHRGGGPSLKPLRKELNAHLESFNTDKGINQIRGHILREVRNKAVMKPGCFSLTVPTGGGKTLASLAFAIDHAITHGMDRIIYVIPFTSIVEQNAAVFRKALGKYGAEAVLEHHSTFDAEKASKGDKDSLDKLKRDSENWDAPIIVTTSVQFLESLFAAKTSRCRKLHNIARSVVILDEAQTMPLPLLRPSVAVLDELALNYHASIVLCTATQPALIETDDAEHSFAGGFKDVEELAPNPINLYQALKRVTVKHISCLDDDQLSNELLDVEQVLCIVNNRRHARALYESIADQPGAFHLTTAMCAVHRRQVLQHIRETLKEGKPCRVVSTSLIEAGVDVDFPRVLRAEAGLDSIAQAAGRCNREGKRTAEESEVRIFATANEEWAPPPELKQFAQATREVLRQHGHDPLSLEAIEAYFTLLYWQQGPDQLDKHQLLSLIENGRLEGLPFETLEKKFRLIDNNQRSVIIPRDDDARKAIKDLAFAISPGRIARKLQLYTVQVPQNGFRALEKAGAIAPIEPDKFNDQFMLLINEDLYDDALGLNWSDPTFMRAESLQW
ncbi:CRISPR-associated helicase Cas3' [Halomonas llamarensis]|uniref:CRISPR-associated helicase Cas3 n=1 Tax=Halomonas llamarensis TaxID=2945104 RepID=A0ABT0SSM5_9GAMM|nr:CRISPR-associated helicase Cas3' [Halomonas llamarensis]MCL7930334.1 CRISPR-associated helicase Cas3' [Halomonas llamarensis]